MRLRIVAVAGVLAWWLVPPTSSAAGMRDCVERGGVWLESGRCELPNDDAAAQWRPWFAAALGSLRIRDLPEEAWPGRP